jgi:hypothetical protein
MTEIQNSVNTLPLLAGILNGTGTLKDSLSIFLQYDLVKTLISIYSVITMHHKTFRKKGKCFVDHFLCVYVAVLSY